MKSPNSKIIINLKHQQILKVKNLENLFVYINKSFLNLVNQKLLPSIRVKTLILQLHLCNKNEVFWVKFYAYGWGKSGKKSFRIFYHKIAIKIFLIVLFVAGVLMP